ncbi:MAG: AmmeMemoRadiSam system protein B, partial [Chloroflexi bacterium]|nr:AmmeMemoRadiSam system protein B [Chloroflexota bacterium]
MTFSPCPKLRPLDVQAAHHNGRQVIVLRDPLGISDRTAVLPQSLAPLLALCDGSRDVSALRASLAVRYGIALPLDTIEQILGALDEALFLDNERFAQARQEQVQAFRSAPYREPALAPHSYPADPDALRKLLDGYLEEAGDVPEAGTLRGLVSPHIDYARGGPVYARVWKSSAKALGEAELVIMLGTDHHGSPGRITLTPQHYATPFGVLPTAGEVV